MYVRKTEVSNMPDAEFKVMIVKIFTGLGKGWKISLRP